jgi:hypothetical protein
MPACRDKLSEEDARAILSYIKMWWTDINRLHKPGSPKCDVEMMLREPVFSMLRPLLSVLVVSAIAIVLGTACQALGGQAVTTSVLSYEGTELTDKPAGLHVGRPSGTNGYALAISRPDRRHQLPGQQVHRCLSIHGRNPAERREAA